MRQINFTTHFDVYYDEPSLAVVVVNDFNDYSRRRLVLAYVAKWAMLAGSPACNDMIFSHHSLEPFLHHQVIANK